MAPARSKQRSLASRLAEHEVAVHVLVPHVNGEGFEIGCGCGSTLPVETETTDVVETWACHVFEVTGLDPELLRRHALARVRAFGTSTVAICSCGDDFVDRTLDPGVVIQLWAGHVVRAANG